MILSRLFARLFAAGVVLVATSNVRAGGSLQGRAQPRPVPALHRPARAPRRRGSPRRGQRLPARQARRRSGLCDPARPAATATLDGLWLALTGAKHGAPLALALQGSRDPGARRRCAASPASPSPTCARRRSAPATTMKIARAFHTVLVDDVPVIADARRDVARRFILLVDTLYDHRVNLIASAAAEPADLYTASARRRGLRLPAHGLAPDRNAFGRLSRRGARTGCRRRGLSLPSGKASAAALAPQHQSG